ncbi:immunity 70 family protein [Paenibacillus filicis]|uniref:Immunity 70 family protein n=1 Tax=Paenibacillus filicis TaxID=669464 RepID=A0ABU9DMI3_9BACL
MAVAFKAEFLYYVVGSGSFLHSFFSTIAYRLESKEWGSVYPILMKQLYDSKVESESLPELRNEVVRVREELKLFPPTDIIWDFDDLSKQPPWGDNISPEITSLSNYFVSSEGKDLFNLILMAIDEATEAGITLEITEFP